MLLKAAMPFNFSSPEYLSSHKRRKNWVSPVSRASPAHMNSPLEGMGIRLIIKQPIKGWFSSAFSQSPTIPPTEDRGLWLRDWSELTDSEFWRPEHTRRHIAVTRRCNKFHPVNRRILSEILLPRQNFVAATCRTKSNWFDFVRHVAATKFCRSDEILFNQPPNVEAFTPRVLPLQPIAAMSAYIWLVAWLYTQSDLLQQRVAAICRLVCSGLDSQPCFWRH